VNKDIIDDWRCDTVLDFFRALLDSIGTPILFCDLNDRMIYMNRAADEHYGKWGGRKILGQSLLDCHNMNSRERIRKIKERFVREPALEEVLITDNSKHRVYMRAVREEGKLIGYFERYEAAPNT